MTAATQPVSQSCLYARPKDAHRHKWEKTPAFRDNYSRDRDRILYSKEFRRLAGKTQVFVSGFDDHFRTRLTHTLEVSQIARTIARSLGLNEILTEAIALGHDVGHTPFGHAGERWLNLIMWGCYDLHGYEEALRANREQCGFRHNWQGVRAVVRLEAISRSHRGLNLSFQTIWGILHHTGLTWKDCPHARVDGCTLLGRAEKCLHGEPPNELPFYAKELDPEDTPVFLQSWSAEALAVRVADEIAQRHHDFEDGVLARILDTQEVLEEFDKAFRPFLSRKERTQLTRLRRQRRDYFLPEMSRLLVNFLASRAIQDSRDRLEPIEKQYRGRRMSARERKATWTSYGYGLVGFGDDFNLADGAFHKFLKERVLSSHLAQSMDGKAGYIIRQLFKAYVTNPEQLPDRTVTLLKTRFDRKLAPPGEIDKNLPVSTGKARDWVREMHNKQNNPHYRNLLLRTICDFLAGMTDSYALERFEDLYESRRPRRALVG